MGHLHSQHQFQAAARQFESSCDCCDPDTARIEAAQVEIRSDGTKLADIDLTASESLDGDDYTQLFAVMADFSDSGLLNRLAQGDAVPAMNAQQSDVFAKVARLADRMANVRDRAIDEAAQRLAA